MSAELIERLRRFRVEHFPRWRDHYRRLVEEGQKPRTLFIGCSDSRVLPDHLLDAGPGDLFIVRNPGAFVPPFEANSGYHGVSAGIEFAVGLLDVSEIVVCGHSHCGAVRALYEPLNPDTPHINRWLELGVEARVDEPVSQAMLRRTEQRCIALQLERLLTFPIVRQRVEAGRLALHGWHYIIEEGTVFLLDLESGRFVPAGD